MFSSEVFGIMGRMGNEEPSTILDSDRELNALDASRRLSQRWRTFADEECGSYSPLYAAISRSLADDPELLALVAEAPPSGQQPNVLLAAVHSLVLSAVSPSLADVYDGLTPPDRGPALFRDLCLTHRADIDKILRTRHTQTNEPGRAALLAIGLGVATDLLGDRIGLLDAGCSAGLNLLLDRYRFDYGSRGAVGPAAATVEIRCELSGAAPVPNRLPTISARLGIDRSPVDLANTDDRQWLLACVWPDTGRLARTAAAIELARQHPPTLVSGDMVTDLDAALDSFEPGLPAVVITTSSCGYLTVEQRHEFLAVLERRADRQQIAWLSVDAPGVVDAFPAPTSTGPPRPGSCVLGLVTFETGTATGRALALCHAHGAWLDWTSS